MASNISTPQKITAQSDSFVERVTTKAENKTENGSATGQEKALPKLGGEKDEQITKAGFGFNQIRENVAKLMHSLGLSGGDATARQNLETTEVGRVMAGGTTNASTIAATAQKVGIEAPQQTPQRQLSELSPDVLALARGVGLGKSGASLDSDHSITYAGVAQPKEAGGGLTTA
jgi:hypothetical protein